MPREQVLSATEFSLTIQSQQFIYQKMMPPPNKKPIILPISRQNILVMFSAPTPSLEV